MRVERWITVIWDHDHATDATEWFGLFRNEKQALAVLDDDGLTRSGIAVKVMVDVRPNGLHFAGVELGVGE